MSASQCDRLLSRLERGEITAMDAWSELGIARLAARISDLRDAGYPISKTMIAVQNRFGEDCRVAKYSLWGQ